MRKGALAVVVAVSMGTTGAARADDAPRTHDGLFLHLDLGLGAFAVQTTTGGVEIELTGGGPQLSIAVGRAVTRQLVLAGQLWLASVASPEVKLNGDSLGRVDGSSLRLVGLGLNVTYYLPSEFYLSATPSLTTLRAKQGGRTHGSELGVAIRFGAGKEWWVGDSWALGLALQLAVGANQGEGADPPTWTTAVAGLMASVTYD